MKAVLKLITSEKSTKNGYPIYVKLTDGNKRFKKVIGHSFINDWDGFNNQPLASHPYYMELMPLVLDLKSVIGKINLMNIDFVVAKNLLLQDDKNASTGFIVFFEDRIKELRSLGKNVDSFVSVKNILKNYVGGEIDIVDINYKFLKQFMVYKLNDGMTEGGVMSYLAMIRSVYKEAQREGLADVTLNPFLGLIKKVDPVEKIRPNLKHIKQLINFTPKKGTTKANDYNIKRAVSVWLFQFYIGGHDYVDIALLNKNHIVNGRIVFKRYKNRNKAGGGPLINNKLFPEALEIINTFGNVSGYRIFNFIPNPKTHHKDYLNYRRNVNHTLSRVSKTLGIPKLTTKTSRYVFRTIAGELLVHDLIVTLLQGHKNNSISYRYQGLISYKKQDKHHKKIIKL